jgi:hypothetical protein
MDKIYRCTIVCTFRVKETLEPYEANNQDIVGFTMPDGSIIRPIVGLEVEPSKGDKYRMVTSENEMGKLGLEDLNYDDVTGFSIDEDLSEELEHEEYELMPLENLPVNMDPDYESTKAIIERRLKEGK